MKIIKMRVIPEHAGRGLKSTLFAIMLSAAAALTVSGAQGPGTESAQETTEAPASSGVLEEEAPLTLDVTYGYQNTAKSGRFLPLHIVMVNHQQEDFRGTLRVTAMEPDFQSYNGQVEYDTYRYEYPVEIRGNSDEEKVLSISLGTRVDKMYISLLDESGHEAARRRLKLKLNMDTAELFVGVLSDNPDKLLYFNNAGIHYGTLRTRMIEMTADSLPSTELGLDQLDVLLISDFDTGVLSDQQADAVWEWVQKGGVLLIGTGARGSDTLHAFRSRLLDSQVPQPELNEVNMGVEYAVDRPEGATIPLVCSEVQLKGGSELFSSDELSVLSAVSVGNGTAAVAIFDFKDIEEFCRENISYVDQLFTALLGEDKINSLSSAMDSSTSSQFWSVQGLINTGNINRLPRVGLYVTLAVAYVVLAGPGLYFFLKQRDLRQYYRPAVAGLSLCCTGMVLLMGISTRFNGPFFTYASIRDMGEEEVSETTFINLRAPYNKPYSVELDPSYTLYPITGSPYYDGTPVPKFTGDEDPAITICYSEDVTKISAGTIGAFNSRFFQLERQQENTAGEGFTGDISAFDGKITGTLTSHYDQAVENVAVLLFNQMIMINHMEPGETVVLDEQKVIYGPTNFGYAMAAQITGASQYQQERDTRNAAYVEALERTNLLSFYIESYLSGYHTEARVVAFSSDREESQFLKNPGNDTYGCTLLTSSIEVNYEKNGMIYRSAMQKRPNVLSGDYYASNNTMYGIAPLILEYYLGNDIEVVKLDFHQPSEEVVENLRYYYTVPFSGGMYFYNYNTGTYDSMDANVTEYSKKKLEPYLSPGNTLTVKYVYDTSGDYTWNIMLPVLTVTGRRK